MLKNNDESLQNYPNMDKWDKLDSNKIRIIQEFIEQCEQQHILLCEYDENEPQHSPYKYLQVNVLKTIAEINNIDYDELQRERNKYFEDLVKEKNE